MNFPIFKTTFLSIFFMTIFSGIMAQESPEYKAEIGIQGGGNVYTGEVNSIASKMYFVKNIKNANLDYGAFLRYKFNTRFALRLGYDNTGVKGNYFSYIAPDNTNLIALNNPNISLINLWGEYNFFDLENSVYKRYSKKYSPFIFAGIGYMLMPNSQTARTNAITIPFGFGLKVKMSTRWNLNLQWTNHLLLSDNLEGLQQYDNPIPKTESNFLNNDMLTGLTVGLSFDFWEKGCNCNNNKYGSSVRRNNNLKPLNNSRPRR